jgi:hypothetical protein
VYIPNLFYYYSCRAESEQHQQPHKETNVLHYNTCIIGNAEGRELAYASLIPTLFFFHFHTFSTSFSAAHVEKWPWPPKVRRDFDMAGEKFDMPSDPGTLFARTFLLVNLQPAQTGRAMSSCCQKSRAEARRWHSAHKNLRNDKFDMIKKFDMVLAKFDMSLSLKNIQK